MSSDEENSEEEILSEEISDEEIENSQKDIHGNSIQEYIYSPETPSSIKYSSPFEINVKTPEEFYNYSTPSQNINENINKKEIVMSIVNFEDDGIENEDDERYKIEEYEIEEDEIEEEEEEENIYNQQSLMNIEDKKKRIEQIREINQGIEELNEDEFNDIFDFKIQNKKIEDLSYEEMYDDFKENSIDENVIINKDKFFDQLKNNEIIYNDEINSNNKRIITNNNFENLNKIRKIETSNIINLNEIFKNEEGIKDVPNKLEYLKKIFIINPILRIGIILNSLKRVKFESFRQYFQKCRIRFTSNSTDNNEYNLITFHNLYQDTNINLDIKTEPKEIIKNNKLIMKSFKTRMYIVIMIDIKEDVNCLIYLCLLNVKFINTYGKQILIYDEDSIKILKDINFITEDNINEIIKIKNLFEF